MMRIDADWLTGPRSQAVCAVLSNAGHQVFFVGGCVRNALFGTKVSDLDLTTDAPPPRVVELAEAAGIKAVPTGIDHGTVTLIHQHVPYEVTTFRRDVRTDGRKAVVSFSESIDEDARRRDFTMNALYADPTGRVHDPLGGLTDLKARRVRFIGDATQRIREDYLRILRFFRFQAWYGGQDIDADGLAACAAQVDGLDVLSKERVGQEVRKLLSAPDPAPSVAAMAQSGALIHVLPGASATGLAVLVHHETALGLAPDPIRRLAVLGALDPVSNLRLSKAEARQIEDLAAPYAPAELGYRLGARAIETLAVRAARAGLPLDQDQIDRAKDGIGQVCPVSAADLMPTLQGPELGKALSDIEKRWVESDFLLTKEDLLA